MDSDPLDKLGVPFDKLGIERSAPRTFRCRTCQSTWNADDGVLCQANACNAELLHSLFGYGAAFSTTLTERRTEAKEFASVRWREERRGTVSARQALERSLRDLNDLRPNDRHFLDRCAWHVAQIPDTDDLLGIIGGAGLDVAAILSEYLDCCVGTLDDYTATAPNRFLGFRSATATVANFERFVSLILVDALAFNIHRGEQS